MSHVRILLVEDDESLGFVLEDALSREGYRITWTRDGRAALGHALGEPWDLIVLDLMLPGLDGYEICKRVRAAGVAVPILMLTARAREEDRVQGLDLGADDYVVKPFSLKELQARIRARLRARKPLAPEAYELGPVRIDLGAMTITCGDDQTTLTKLEAGVLTLFLANPGTVLSRGRFLDEVWGYHRHPTTRTVDMHVARVREKIGAACPTPRSILRIHGVGYRFDP